MGLTAAISREIDRFGRAHGTKTDFGEIAQLALVESLNDAVAPRLPTLLQPDPADIRRALARLASGDRFGALARGFFARLTSRTLDYYLSRELANHVGPGGVSRTMPKGSPSTGRCRPTRSRPRGSSRRLPAAGTASRSGRARA